MTSVTGVLLSMQTSLQPITCPWLCFRTSRPPFIFSYTQSVYIKSITREKLGRTLRTVPRCFDLPLYYRRYGRPYHPDDP